MSTFTRISGEQSRPRGLKKRLIALMTVLLMAMGFSGLSALPADASDSEQGLGEGTTETVRPSDDAEDDDEEAGDDGEEASSESDVEQDAASVEVSFRDGDEVSEATALRQGVHFWGSGFEPGTQADILLNGETLAAETASRTGVISYVHEGGLSAGEHTFAFLAGGATYSATLTVTAGGYEPDAWISQDEVSERDTWFFGITITGDGAEPGTDAEILLNSEAIATIAVDEYEYFSYTHEGLLPAGDHVFTVAVSGQTIDLPLTVTAGGYDPSVDLSLGVEDGGPVVSEWNVSRDGFSVTGYDFAPGSTIDASVNGTEVGTGTVDEYGTVLIGQVALELSAGTHTLVLNSEEVTGSVDFTVLSDDEFYDIDEQGVADLGATANLRVANQTELASGELWTRSHNFPGSHALDLYINDELVARGISGTEQYVVTDLDPGAYTATWRLGAYSASVDFAVVPDEQGTPAPEGTYEGTSDIGEDSSVDLIMEIDENGVLTNFSSPRWFQCVGYQGIPTDPFEFDWDVPATPITVDQPFEIRWDSYVISGIVNSDGSAFGEAEWRIPCWGAIHDHWTAQGDVIVPDPDPADEPTSSPTPTEEPTSGPGDDAADDDGISAPSTAVTGSEITIGVGSSYAGEAVSVWLNSDPVLLGTPVVRQDGTVVVTLPDGVVGEHTLEVVDAEGELIGTSAITITAATGTDEDDDADPAAIADGDGEDDGASDDGATDYHAASGQEDSPAGGGLAATGATIGVLTFGAALLLVLGFAALGMSRRQSHQSAR